MHECTLVARSRSACMGPYHSSHPHGMLLHFSITIIVQDKLLNAQRSQFHIECQAYECKFQLQRGRPSAEHGRQGVCVCVCVCVCVIRLAKVKKNQWSVLHVIAALRVRICYCRVEFAEPISTPASVLCPPHAHEMRPLDALACLTVVGVFSDSVCPSVIRMYMNSLCLPPV